MSDTGAARQCGCSEGSLWLSQRCFATERPELGACLHLGRCL